MKTNSVVVTSKDDQENEVTLVVKRPSHNQQAQAQLAASRAGAAAIRQGSLTRAKVDEFMREEGSWDDEKQAELDKLVKLVSDAERQLARGGKKEDGTRFSKKEARDLAIQMRVWRSEQWQLLAKRNELDQFTVEGCAENARFDYLVSQCVYNEEGDPFFENMEDYNKKADQPYASEAAAKLSELVYGLDAEHEKKRVENKFLVRFGFAREKDGRLVNDEGHLIDADGNLLDEDGRFVNEAGDYVDRYGNRVDKDGNPVEEFFPFEEDIEAQAEKLPEETKEEEGPVSATE